VGLGAVAPTLVHTMLKPAWHDVAPMLTILSALSVTRPIGWTINSYLQARDATRAIMILEFVKLVAIVAAIVTLGRISPLWACGAVGVAFALHALASLWVVRKIDQIPLARTIGRCLPPLFACAPMVLAVLGVRWALAHAGIEIRGVGLVLELVAGAIGYVVGALVLARSVSLDFLNLVKNAVRRRRGK
jgi:lipopolysaccharide exporter